MKVTALTILILFSFRCLIAQENIVSLYEGPAPGSEDWDWHETEYKNDAFNLRFIYNISNPTLTIMEPEAPSGTAIVICPGGGFQFLSIDNEGYEVAKQLNKKGITAFVLKYRVRHSLTDNPMQEFMDHQPNTAKFNKEIEPVVAMGINDGKQAITWVREHASDYNIDPDRIGIIGFSAGGTVTTGVAYTYDINSKPNFVAPIYPYVGSFDKPAVPADAPPMFICAATDDTFGFEDHCIKLYNEWNNAGRPVEMHIYGKGGHGFGMSKRNLPVDSWLQRFTDWLEMFNFVDN